MLHAAVSNSPHGGDVLAVVADEIAGNAVADGTTAGDVWVWTTWSTWATARHLSVGPASEADIARFLTAHRHRWRGATMRNVVASINREHSRRGWPTPARHVVHRLLVSVERLEGISITDPRPALLPVVAGKILVRLNDWQPVPGALIGIVLIRRGVDLIDVPAIDPACSRPTRIGWRIGTHKTGVSLRNAEASERSAGEAIAVLAANRTAIDTLNSLTNQIWAAMERAGLPAAMSPHQLTATIRGLSEDEFLWLVQWCDPTLARRMRNRALIGVGVAAARRGVELSRIDRDDITQLDQGWLCIFRQHKTAPNGDRPIERVVGHIGDDTDPCDATCPACALGDWLALSDRRWPGRPSAAVFPSKLYRFRSPSGRLTAQGVRYIVRSACVGIDDVTVRLGSSSLRIGGATGAYLAGMDPVTIALELTGHESLDHLPKYIRLQLPEHNTYRLPL